MLGEVVVQIATVHQVQDEAQFVRGVKCIRHAHDERAVDLEKGKERERGDKTMKRLLRLALLFLSVDCGWNEVHRGDEKKSN